MLFGEFRGHLERLKQETMNRMSNRLDADDLKVVEDAFYMAINYAENLERTVLEVISSRKGEINGQH